jgi:hypothetical protein
MPTPDKNQAPSTDQSAQSVSKNYPEPQSRFSSITSSESLDFAKSESWKVPDYLNAFWNAPPEQREQIIANIEHEVSAVGGFSTTFQDINVQSTGIAMPRTIMAGGAIASILRTIGQSIKDDIIMAQQYAKDDELVASIIRTKNTFFSCGFDLTLQAGGGKDEKKKTLFKNFKLSQRINKVAKDILNDWNTSENAVLIWSVQNNEIVWLTTIGAERCVYKNHNGQDKLAVALDNEAMREITSYINTGGPENTGVSVGEIPQYPERWVEAAKNGGSLMLDREQGDGWAIVTTARKFNGFARPSMRSVYFDLMLRDLLKAGEWACAIFVQSCIQHIKIGPADYDVKVGPRAGQKDYPYQKMLNSLNLMFQTPSRARRVITDATVSIEHVVPDVKMFTKEKFSSCDSRIEDWGGVPQQIRTGQGAGYSQGFLGKSRFEADGLNAREAVEEVFNAFFSDPMVRKTKTLRLGDEDEVVYSWNKQILKDPKQVLEEIKFMQNNGLIDPRTIHELLGVNHDSIRSRMLEYHKDRDEEGKTIWMPDFEPRQGLLTETKDPEDDHVEKDVGEPGRPVSDGPSMRRPRVVSAMSNILSGSAHG